MTMKTEYADQQISLMLLVLGTFIVVGNAIAIGAIYGPTVRLLALLVGLLVLGSVLHATRLRVTCGPTEIRVDRAHIGWDAVERIEILDGEEFRRALGVTAHPNDYVRIRGNRSGMRVWLADVADPHRAWVVSVRDTARLRSALTAMGRMSV